DVLNDYHSILLPKAVDYSAGVLDYFFRGRIAVCAVTALANSQIQIQVANVSGTNLYGGFFEVYADDQNGQRSLLNLNPRSLTESLAEGACMTFTFTRPTTPLSVAKYILVYRGTIGTTGTGLNLRALDSVDDGIAIATTSFYDPNVKIPKFANVSKVT